MVISKIIKFLDFIFLRLSNNKYIYGTDRKKSLGSNAIKMSDHNHFFLTTSMKAPC